MTWLRTSTDSPQESRSKPRSTHKAIGSIPGPDDGTTALQLRRHGFESYVRIVSPTVSRKTAISREPRIHHGLTSLAWPSQPMLPPAPTEYRAAFWLQIRLLR